MVGPANVGCKCYVVHRIVHITEIKQRELNSYQQKGTMHERDQLLMKIFCWEYISLLLSGVKKPAGHGGSCGSADFSYNI